MDETLAYYEQNAAAFVAGTQNADMSGQYRPFLKQLPSGGKLLDLGCGSGRDSAFFSSLGFAVTALDGSKELCKLVKKNHGIDALCIRFEDLSFQAEFDGIWACASLLHIRKAHMSDILSKVSAALKPGGILYASFKYGTGEHFHNGRFFNNYTEADLPTLLTPETRLTLLEYRITGDVRPECAGQRWLSFIAKKQTEV